ncbi:ABC transporter permease [Micromonospora sp. NBC_01796]|uniref:ABC transporter permease n=1 Tax=Micromonospora sp. NBC_01796 TaxID=2975987 RepID=UPI002DD97CB1|nr:ABC transporter permease [Micromonospora sp. NBC_01796]WSA84097.1 ABC transporter permease [Micromonospora sp. NBC_01796]
MNAFALAFGEGTVVAKRNLRMILRVPELLLNAAVAPAMMTLLFGFIIGGAIDVAGVPYREYLLGGIFVQAVLFGAVNTGTAIAGDLRNGIVDRLMSMPISRSAVLVGRTTSDVVNSAVVITVTALLGLVVGWRVHSSFPDAVLGFALLLAFAYALSWLMAVVGLASRAPEVVSSTGFTIAIPLGFLSNAYVPIQSMPGVLQTIAEWNPVSAIVQALRVQFGNVDPSTAPDVWPMQHPVAASLLWIGVLLALSIPLAISQFRKAAGG